MHLAYAKKFRKAKECLTMKKVTFCLSMILLILQNVDSISNTVLNRMYSTGLRILSKKVSVFKERGKIKQMDSN